MKRPHGTCQYAGFLRASTCIQADLSTDQGADHLLTEIQNRKLAIDVLVKNAGVSYRGALQDLQPGEVNRVPGIANQFAVNWVGYQPRWLVTNLGGVSVRLQARKT